MHSLIKKIYMKKIKQTITLIAFVLLAQLALFTQSAYAADIGMAKHSNGRELDAILVEGKILPGDFQKFKEVYKTTGASKVFLASPGGDLTEAIKIGNFIRDNYLETLAPYVVDKTFLKLKSIKNNVCTSSCFFIYIAGINRTGNVVGIHRPYMSEQDYLAISIADAKNKHENIREYVSQYLKKMSVPIVYVDEMFKVDPNKVKWLSNEEIQKNFEGYIDSIKDWIKANCTRYTDQESRRADQAIARLGKQYPNSTIGQLIQKAEGEDKKIIDKYFNGLQSQVECEQGALQKVRYEKLRQLIEERSK